jgi:hypothetical protein
MAELWFPVPPLAGDVVLLRPWGEAVRLLARWAFAEPGLARLELTCGPDNEASQHVAERCGFSRESLLRSHVPFKGAGRDSVILQLAAWRAAVAEFGTASVLVLAAATGASLKELMARLGHSSTRAAMIYQHATRDRDQAIAKALGGLVQQVRTGTATRPQEASGDA